ncbi:MAG: molybdenum cofactor cytidylyltransferase [Phycisphaerales bacterium]|nr:molybdenum cofactor cytidylyltransferase [Phycisphaerales bacterium]
MGRPKLLLPWRGRTIITDVVERARAAASHVVVVTGHDSSATVRELTGHDIHIVHNSNYADGEMISSVKTGIAALPPACEAFFLVLGDQPGIAAETFERIIAAWRGAAAGAATMIVSPRWNNCRGHPVLISAAGIDEILALPADATLKTFVARHAAGSIEVEVEDPAILADVDTPEQYRRLTEMQTETGSLSCPTEVIAAD